MIWQPRIPRLPEKLTAGIQRRFLRVAIKSIGGDAQWGIHINQLQMEELSQEAIVQYAATRRSFLGLMI